LKKIKANKFINRFYTVSSMIAQKKQVKLDNIGIIIIEELRKDPRISLREICCSLAKKGLKASAETVRKRIAQLKTIVRFQPVPLAGAFGVEEAILLIKMKGARTAKERLVSKLRELQGFNIIELVGQFDIMVFFVFKDCANLSRIMDAIKTMPEVEEVQQMFVSKSHTSISPLLRQLTKAPK